MLTKFIGYLNKKITRCFDRVLQHLVHLFINGIFYDRDLGYSAECYGLVFSQYRFPLIQILVHLSRTLSIGQGL